MFDRLKFLGKIREKGKSVQEVAKFLGINPATLYRKMNGDSDFYRDEIERLCTYLDIKDPMKIFFAEKIAYTQDDEQPKKAG